MIPKYIKDKIESKVSDECILDSQEGMLRQRFAYFGYSLASPKQDEQDELWREVYSDFQDIFDYRQSSVQRDKWFEQVKKEYSITRNPIK